MKQFTTINIDFKKRTMAGLSFFLLLSGLFFVVSTIYGIVALDKNDILWYNTSVIDFCAVRLDTCERKTLTLHTLVNFVRQC